MKKSIMKKWVAALRSGEFKQGQGKLKHKNDNGEISFCCLGVAREIGLVNKKQQGYELCSFEFMSKKNQAKLAVMNDGSGPQYKRPRTFKEIAAYIQRNYKKL